MQENKIEEKQEYEDGIVDLKSSGRLRSVIHTALESEDEACQMICLEILGNCCCHAGDLINDYLVEHGAIDVIKKHTKEYDNHAEGFVFHMCRHLGKGIVGREFWREN